MVPRHKHTQSRAPMRSRARSNSRGKKAARRKKGIRQEQAKKKRRNRERGGEQEQREGTKKLRNKERQKDRQSTATVAEGGVSCQVHRVTLHHDAARVHTPAYRGHKEISYSVDGWRWGRERCSGSSL